MEEVAFDQDRYYPAIEPPDGANGEIRSLAAPTKCIDTQFKVILAVCVKLMYNHSTKHCVTIPFMSPIHGKSQKALS